MEIGQFFKPYKMFIGSIMPNKIMKSTELSDGAKICYARLCQFAGKDGNAFPSYETLSKEMGVSRITAIRRVNELEKFGLVKVNHNNGRTNSYKFLWHKIFEDNSEEDELGTTNNNTIGDITDDTSEVSDMIQRGISNDNTRAS